MEREIEGMEEDLKLVEESCGTGMLNLVLVRAYLLKLTEQRPRGPTHGAKSRRAADGAAECCGFGFSRGNRDCRGCAEGGYPRRRRIGAFPRDPCGLNISVANASRS